MSTFHPVNGGYQPMRTIEQIAPDVRRIVLAAVADLGPDLGGYSPVDLVIDQLADTDPVSCADAKTLLVVAGVDSHLSPRCVARYSR